jgi:UDP-2,3-diacylglucosamine hydrolase
MMQGKKIFFASDFHLGSDGKFSSKEREKIIVEWLSSIENKAEAIYLMGDIFDYWFEYKEVVPRGFTLLLGKLHDLRLKGVPVIFFTGNHDMWIFDYLEKEMDIQVKRKPVIEIFNNKIFFLAHGDGLGNVPLGDKLMKIAFSNSFLQWLFARIHPNTGIRIMKFFSNVSRNTHSEYSEEFIQEKEFLLQFAEDYIKNDDSIDYFVFGHRHIPVKYPLSNSRSFMVNLGDWIENFTYGEFDGEQFNIRKYDF